MNKIEGLSFMTALFLINVIYIEKTLYFHKLAILVFLSRTY